MSHSDVWSVAGVGKECEEHSTGRNKLVCGDVRRDNQGKKGGCKLDGNSHAGAGGWWDQRGKPGSDLQGWEASQRQGEDGRQ